MGAVRPASALEQRIAGIAALDQPMRRELYRLLSDGAWHSRDEAAGSLDVARSVAAFHLDKLAEAGVLEVRFERVSGRSGPGAGRPSKLYRLAADEIAASVPQRRYDLAGAILATAVAESTRTGRAVRDCLREVARDEGRAVGQEAIGTGTDDRRSDRDAVMDVLTRHGYEPGLVRREVALANCPFHRLAEQERELVCGMNLDYLAGVLEGIGAADTLTVRLAPEPGRCCVRIATT
jgi:predicted ArsR family transcriptional regulator